MDDDGEIKFPISNSESSFIQLNHFVDQAMTAGFSRQESFELVKQIHDYALARIYSNLPIDGEDDGPGAIY